MDEELDEELIDGAFKGRPKPPTEKELGIQQIPFRLHINDHKLLKKLLTDEGMKFQTFVDACVQAYLRGDPLMLKFIKDWKELNSIPKEFRGMYTLSHRERMNILDELEKKVVEPVSGAAGRT